MKFERSDPSTHWVLCGLLFLVGLSSGACDSVSRSSGDPVLFFEGFNTGGTQFALNQPFKGGEPTDLINQWVVNNAYEGGTRTEAICGTTPQPSDPVVIPDTPEQPTGIIGRPRSGYLHMLSTAALDQGIESSSFQATDPEGNCAPPESYFAAMKESIITLGYTEVTLEFWWLGEGSATGGYGEVYYDADPGNVWTRLDTPRSKYSGQAEWTREVVTLPDFDQRDELRFGFRFVNDGPGSDPPFSIDDVKIVASPSPIP